MARERVINAFDLNAMIENHLEIYRSVLAQ